FSRDLSSDVCSSDLDHLVLLHAGLAAETLRDDLGGIMVSVSGKVADRHLCVGNPLAYQFFDLMCVHSHAKSPAVSGLFLSFGRIVTHHRGTSTTICLTLKSKTSKPPGQAFHPGGKRYRRCG